MTRPDATKKPQVLLEWEPAGHYFEYLLRVQDRHLEILDIPSGWEAELEELLGLDWKVMDRVSRVELQPKNLKRTPETDQQLRTALLILLAQGYELRELFKDN